MPARRTETKRTTVFHYDPDELVIIGHDTEDGPEHYLYDERVHQKGYISEAMVKNIEAMGIIESISVTKIGKSVAVVNGRRRVLAARKANKKLRKRGEEIIRVPAIPRKGDEEGLMGVLISGNEHRLDDDPITRAEKAQRLKERGRNNVQIGMYFGVSGTAVGNWLKALDCVPVVKNAVRIGEISMSAAIELSNLEPEKQQAALEEMVVSGNTSVDRAREHAEGEGEGEGSGGGGGGIRKAPKKTLLRKVIEHETAGKVLGKGFLKGVMFAIGDLEAENVKGLVDLIDEVQ